MKNSKSWIFSTIILSFLVFGLSGYIVYDKLFKGDVVVENNVLDNNYDNDLENIVVNESNISWIDYLNQQQFVSATLSVCKIDNNYVYNKDVDMQPNPGAGRDITQDELKQLFNSIYQSNRENPYGEVVKGYGYSAPACRDEIIYKYVHNGKEYEFLLADGTIIETEDEDFISVLNSYVENYTNYALNQNNNNYYSLVKDLMKDYVKYYKNNE